LQAAIGKDVLPGENGSTPGGGSSSSSVNLSAVGHVFLIAEGSGTRAVRSGGASMSMEEEAVAQLYRDHAAALRRFVLAATSDPDQAEDVVQETILRVWKLGPEVENMRGYLYRTARHVIIDNHRRRSSRAQETNMPEEELATADQVDRLLLKVVMEEALTRLSVDHRNVILALHYQRLTAAEAAEELHVPLGTVKSRAFYGVKALRSVLDEMGVKR
jgi:RNA polymerase sigma-70 factor (ECF subfamily)